MGIYELVPYWEPQYVKCQAEAMMQVRPQAEPQSAPALADHVFQPLAQAPELIFSVQACIPYISIALIAVLLGLGLLFVKGCACNSGMGIVRSKEAGYIHQYRFFCFFR